MSTKFREREFGNGPQIANLRDKGTGEETIGQTRPELANKRPNSMTASL
jgi:hypothetical protein